jgi:Helix-turn-helix domain
MDRTRVVTNGNGTKRASTVHRGRSRRAPQGPPRDAADQVLTSREAREYLRIGRTKLHELTQRQIVPAYRIGRGRTSALRYLKRDLLEWLVRQRV